MLSTFTLVDKSIQNYQYAEQFYKALRENITQRINQAAICIPSNYLVVSIANSAENDKYLFDVHVIYFCNTIHLLKPCDHDMKHILTQNIIHIQMPRAWNSSKSTYKALISPKYFKTSLFSSFISDYKEESNCTKDCYTCNHITQQIEFIFSCQPEKHVADRKLKKTILLIYL